MKQFFNFLIGEGKIHLILTVVFLAAALNIYIYGGIYLGQKLAECLFVVLFACSVLVLEVAITLLHIKSNAKIVIEKQSELTAEIITYNIEIKERVNETKFELLELVDTNTKMLQIRKFLI